MRKLYAILCFVLIILAGLLFFWGPSINKTIQKTFSLGDGDKTNPGENAALSPSDQENSQDGAAVSSDNGLGGSGNSGESAGNNSTQNCTQTIAYTMSDFSEQEICNIHQDETCVDKTVNCSVSLQNLDPNLSGDFTVRFYFNDYETGETISTLAETHYLSSKQKLQFLKTQNFSPADSNKNIDCRFSTENAPTRNIC